MQKVRPIDANALRNKICAACAERLACTDIGNICFEVACIDNAPTIEPEVRHGRWIPVDGEPYAKCSYCGEKHYGCTTPYCDMCGAYMRKDGADNG